MCEVRWYHVYYVLYRTFFYFGGEWFAFGYAGCRNKTTVVTSDRRRGYGRCYNHDSEVTKYLTYPPHKTVDDTLRIIKKFYLTYEKRGVPQTWAMIHKKDDKVIGNLNIHTIDEDIGEIGYVLHPSYWNQGLMCEAIKELISVSFTHIGLRRIEAKVAKENVRSIQVLKKCGFVQEGILRKYAKLSDGYYHDMILLSLLKEDIRRGDYEKDIRREI